MIPTVNDDDVLAAMTAMGLDASVIKDFRYVRARMRVGMPLCCILNMHVIDNYRPDMDGDDVMKLANNPRHRKTWAGRWAAELLEFLTRLDRYANAAEAKAGRELYYSPCPACFISGNFADVPPEADACWDEYYNPGPEGDQQE